MRTSKLSHQNMTSTEGADWLSRRYVVYLVSIHCIEGTLHHNLALYQGFKVKAPTWKTEEC